MFERSETKIIDSCLKIPATYSLRSIYQ